jgi:hypothetical protein
MDPSRNRSRRTPMCGVRNRAITRLVDLPTAKKESFGEVSNTCFSGGARACTRSVASLTSKRSTRHRLSPADSRKSGSSGDDRSGERSRDRSTDRSRERSRGSCYLGRRQVPRRQDPMFVDLGHDTHLPQTCSRLRFPARSRCVTAPSSQAISGTTSRSRFPRESPKKSRCLVSRFLSLGGLCREMTAKPLSPQVFGVPRCTERRSERNRGGRCGTPHSLLLRGGHKGSARVESCLRRLRGGIVEPYCGG